MVVSSPVALDQSPHISSIWRCSSATVVFYHGRTCWLSGRPSAPVIDYKGEHLQVIRDVKVRPLVSAAVDFHASGPTRSGDHFPQVSHPIPSSFFRGSLADLSRNESPDAHCSSLVQSDSYCCMQSCARDPDISYRVADKEERYKELMCCASLTCQVEDSSSGSSACSANM